jgi:hypothetical protein
LQEVEHVLHARDPLLVGVFAVFLFGVDGSGTYVTCFGSAVAVAYWGRPVGR